MEPSRPDPDLLLAALQKDEARQKRGKLKIFFGMAAGVGKTYAMLDAARQLAADGIDVVVGYVETHGRAETEALLSGLEVIPRQKLEYRGVIMEEMDTDAILARRPRLALVDELAHTNVPGSRHAKRYQDAIELLEAGIDVWTTVNVQHFESRADSVSQITGITVHETLPDSILDLADAIELIDLSPEDLRKRLAEGKVYTPDRVETAAQNFFRTGNLTALREMALRLTAEHVDHTLQDYMQIKRIAGPWKSGERLLVAVGPSPFSERLIRWTRRMAYNLEAPWLAVYVKTSRDNSPEEEHQLVQNLSLARSLGGEIVITASNSISEALVRVAQQHNVSQIVIGKPKASRPLRFFHGRSLVDDVLRLSGEIDVYVVTGDDPEARPAKPPQLNTSFLHSTWKGYAWAMGIVALTTALDLILLENLPWIGYQVVGLTELVAVLLVAVYIGRGPALLAAAISAVSWDFLFIDPRLTFEVSRLQDVTILILYFVVALFTGNLTARLRSQERLAQYNVEYALALYALAREAATAVNMDDVLRSAVAQIGRVFDAEVAILLTQNGQLARQPHPASTLAIDEKEYSVALWVFQHGKSAGRFTDTLSLAAAQYLPLRTASRTVGVIGVCPRLKEELPLEQEALLATFVSQVALVIERELLDEAAEQATMLRESERLYTTLLNSISHELRTPIASIMGAASSLLDSQTGANPVARRELTADIQSAARRLNRLVENLLDMSRLESGRLQLKREWCDLGDLIGVAVKRLANRLGDHPLTIACDPGLPLIQLDFVLMEQVLVNLLDNACNYTPAGTPVIIEAGQDEQGVYLQLSDRGPGLPESDLERVFDKFYRVPGTLSGGTGLGLSVCKGLVEAHGGTLAASNVPGGGACFLIRLPSSGAPPPVQEARL